MKQHYTLTRMLDLYPPVDGNVVALPQPFLLVYSSNIFLLCLTGAGVGDVTALIKDAQGNKNTVEVVMEDKGESVYRCTYRPVQAGPHIINITFGGIAIPKSPFTVNIGPGN